MDNPIIEIPLSRVNRNSCLPAFRAGNIVLAMETLQDRLKEARRDAGLTQVQLAKRVGITQASYSELERGEGRGSKHIVPLAAALGVRPEWLQTGGLPKTAAPDVQRTEEVLRLWDSITEDRKDFLLEILRAAAQREIGHS